MRQLISDGVKVQMCVTSPPYFGLRDYLVDGQLGQESTPEEFIANLVDVFRLVRELLADDGVCFVNIGDSYAGYWGDKKAKEENRPSKADGHGFSMNARPKFHDAFDGSGIKPKDLIGIPWMLAFALRADGWYLRQDIIWAKPNPMPESVTDRCTKSHEYIFLLSKSQKYYYNADAIKEGCKEVSTERAKSSWNPTKLNVGLNGPQNESFEVMGNRWVKEKANKRSVWTVPTKSYSGAHFATYPPELIIPCILAGSRVGDIVFDPFFGSGTTGETAERLGRKWIGCELNQQYKKLQDKRTEQVGMIWGTP